MKKYNFLFVSALALLVACGGEKTETEKQEKNNDTLAVTKDTATKTVTTTTVNCKNDSLDELAELIAGINDGQSKVLTKLFQQKSFQDHAQGFDRKWNEFDSSRLSKLEGFRSAELSVETGPTKTLFYPFSGPDFLYANAFFPEAEKYVLMGLEPVGTLPVYDEPEEAKDSMSSYYSKIKPALHAILNFSFFRTASMKNELRNEELDGTLHLLLLFIKRTGHDICDINPGFIDTTGNWQYLSSFPELSKKSLNNKGIEIRFTTKDGKLKMLYYFSLHLEDGALKHNKNVLNYFKKLGDVNTYLKGASYLMHEGYFSEIRNTIFRISNRIIQDDSGIAFRYFAYSGFKWDYKFYGKYTRPISLFSYAYQADLDSLWKKQGAKDIGFGIGYNFRDKNSNLMIAKKGEVIPIPLTPILKPKSSKSKTEKESKSAD